MRFSKNFYPICIYLHTLEAMALALPYWPIGSVCLDGHTTSYFYSIFYTFFSIKRESFLSSHRCLVSFIRCMTRGNFLETKRHFCFVPYYTQAHFAKKNSSNRIFWPKKIKLLLLGSPNTMNKYLWEDSKSHFCGRLSFPINRLKKHTSNVFPFSNFIFWSTTLLSSDVPIFTKKWFNSYTW